ncbi:uracil-DNA glycosylase family protein [Sphingorhabdus wooponensis]|jgi:uracil-DNA glycosylase family 4|uniref:Uracil-DNA glycosylase-like domain-containing protein n=1 Tax=Sphingorhabdus wooponensis TaxID=940136 RepID=A0A3R8S5D9_9SPHN|nr:uracil-DNA glycosylase family protein [Sphingorhabdus wooponensis]RRQ52212.1 hypothetical protein D7D48_04925 [Sphingorhabdus wooponensis]
MEDKGKVTAFAVFESLSGWWELAGVDSAVHEDTVDLLSQETIVATSKVAVTAHSEKKLAEIPAPIPASPTIIWPNDILGLRDMVTSGASLPGNAYGPIRFPPVGPMSCQLMIISDLPDIIAAPDTTMQLNAGLLHRMLAAIGIDMADCYCTWLATSVPSTGDVPENDLANLAAFMRHQIQLIQPKSLVILGSAACNALLGEELIHARAKLHNIKYDDISVPTMATFHPRTLIARPAMKKLAWIDLQMFAKKVMQ